ncbi:MAG: radical SAM/SPASM domain-containing protein [Flavobacteriales bacterium]|nr:radical SAM/SPASM domain-containing protein [Flavobacteriales bacterium]
MLNIFKLYLSFIFSRITKKSFVLGTPFALSIEPTTTCNLGCPECPSGLRQFTRKTGNLTPEINKKIIDELKNNLTYINYYFQGEPYINRHLFEMIKYANQNNIYCSTSTNGHFLTDKNCKKTIESGLQRLIISIDGVDQKSYENYRINGDFSKVITGTKNIIKWKEKLKSQTPHIIFQFLVVKTNEHLIEDIKSLSKSLKINELRLKTAQFYEFKKGNPLMPTNDQYSRYKLKEDGEYELKNKLYNHCWRMWSSAVVTVNGEIVPCCFDKDAVNKIGSLHTDKFKTIWNSQSYNKFRSLILKGRNEIEICKNCSEGSKVWA